MGGGLAVYASDTHVLRFVVINLIISIVLDAIEIHIVGHLCRYDLGLASFSRTSKIDHNQKQWGLNNNNLDETV